MKKYLVIGNPIEHSLSPKLHNYWFKKNNIKAVYNIKKINEIDIKKVVSEMKDGKIDGINVTVPFKKSIIPFLDKLTSIANEARSVNTIYSKDNIIFGDNTDVSGFEYGLNHIDYNVKGKKIFILGAGGVVPSIILALKKMSASKIILSNRTKEKAEDIKKIYPYIELADWGDIKPFDMIINATSVGLKVEDELKLNFGQSGSNKLFYDVIYNPKKTNFLLQGKKLGSQTENGKKMFAYQAQLAFETWHGIKPSVDEEVLQLLEND